MLHSSVTFPLSDKQVTYFSTYNSNSLSPSFVAYTNVHMCMLLLRYTFWQSDIFRFYSTLRRIDCCACDFRFEIDSIIIGFLLNFHLISLFVKNCTARINQSFLRIENSHACFGKVTFLFVNGSNRFGCVIHANAIINISNM